jgi:hypothetical protein
MYLVLAWHILGYEKSDNVDVTKTSKCDYNMQHVNATYSTELFTSNILQTKICSVDFFNY